MQPTQSSMPLSPLNIAIVSIGSNVDNASEIIDNVIKLLAGDIITCTQQYQDPLDNDISKPYTNVIATIQTTLSHNELNNKFKQTEQAFGRRHDDTVNVPLDIDIVIFNNNIVRPDDYARDYFQYGYRFIEKPAPRANER